MGWQRTRVGGVCLDMAAGLALSALVFPVGLAGAQSGSVSSGPKAVAAPNENSKQPMKADAVPGPWEMQESHTTASLRGIHAVGAGVAWASGTDGTVLRTEDGGYLWQKCTVPPNGDKLDFRGVWAWDAQTAVVMSSGPGDLSRLYKTTDGCRTWKLLYTNPDAKGFWDAVAFWDRDHGFILGDPVEEMPMRTEDGKVSVSKLSKPRFLTLQTLDGGEHWACMDTGRGSHIEPGAKGAGAFAASNSSVFMPAPSIEDSGRGYNLNWSWLGVGGASGAFVYVGVDVSIHPPLLGWEWTGPFRVPLASGTESSGVFSLAFRPVDQTLGGNGSGVFYPTVPTPHSAGKLPLFPTGVAVGGDYQKPSESSGTAARTPDGGRTWTAATRPPHGYRSAVAWDAPDKAWIAAGTNGSDVSYDDGNLWQPLDDGNWNALSLPWVVGPKGRIAKLVSLKGQAKE